MLLSLKSVLISDPVDEGCASLLTRYGISVTTKFKLSHSELIKELANHDGLIVRSETKVTADVIAATANLKVIGRAGTGIDNIDISAATRKGILVLNTPGGNGISACELTCAMISALPRKLIQACQSMKDGRWDRQPYTGRELSGRILGILGFGRIGREVAHRMKAYGMNVIAYDPFLSDIEAIEHGIVRCNLDKIWKNADFITVHTPLTPQTKNLINTETLSKCKKGVYIINVARGGIIDEEALLNSINADHCAGAALDVFLEEPPKNPITLKLINHTKVITTPHLGASTAEAQRRVAVVIAEQFLRISGKSREFVVTGIVNSPIIATAISADNEPWVDLARKLGIIARKLVSNHSQVAIECCTTGTHMLSRNFVHTAFRVGLLTNQLSRSINLVNAANIAKELHIHVNEKHENDGQNAIIVKAGPFVIKGTVIADAALLLSINDTVFVNGVQLHDNISLYRVKKPEHLSQIVSCHVDKFVSIYNISVTDKWIVVQTDKSISLMVDDIDSY